MKKSFQIEKSKVQRKRHIAKTITWRIVGSLDTLMLATFFSGSFEIGGWIAITEVITKTILYYLHERVWYSYNWETKNKKRHLSKTISWRFIGTLDTLLLSWVFTGSPLTGVKIITGELITKMLLYYLHERAWYASNWGVIKTEDQSFL
jgi:uncharacterized membrane protein